MSNLIPLLLVIVSSFVRCSYVSEVIGEPIEQLHLQFQSLTNQTTGYIVNNNSLVFVVNYPISYDFSPVVCVKILEYNTLECTDSKLRLFVIPVISNLPIPQKITTVVNDGEIALTTSHYLIKSDQTTLFYQQDQGSNDWIDEYSFAIVKPENLFGLLVAGQLDLSFQLITESSRILDDSQYYIRIIAKGIFNNDISITATTLRSIIDNYIEPASWFISYEIIGPSMSDYFPLISYSHIEFILTNKQIYRERAFKSNNISSQLLNQSIDEINIIQRINVCIWASNRLDGQKNIWLQQIRHMNSSKFRFNWILTVDSNVEPYSNTSLINILTSNPNVTIFMSPYSNYVFNLDLLNELPSDGSLDANNWIKQQQLNNALSDDTSYIYKYASMRFKEANYSLVKVSPSWVRDIYSLARDTLVSATCDVVVIGSSRGFTSDVFIIDTAVHLGISTVAELLNLFPDPDLLTNVLVGPSQYAIHHRSVAAAIDIKSTLCEDRHYTSNCSVDSLVISPAVDTNVFDPSRLDLVSKRHEDCPTNNCILIGFIARLSPEKNPGLFLLSASILLSISTVTLRFVVIGDGVIRSELEDLANRLDISYAVRFEGWISNDLPDWIKSMDIVINTSLRGWSETFCIANIEVMSMKIPLVTFGIGGIGEYIEQPSDIFKDDTYVVVSNGVIVNEASPEAISMATLTLIYNQSLREAIGSRARETVLTHFTAYRQIVQYDSLYSHLYKSNQHRTKYYL